jgi:hypothetical protein
MVGDSTTAGAGSNGAGGGAGSGGTIAPTALRSKSMPKELTNLFAAAGVPARTDAFWGCAVLGTATVANYSLYNPDVAFSGSWAIAAAGLLGIGGNFFTLAASQNGTITFTPQQNSNRLDCVYVLFPGNGGFTVSDSSGLLATIDTNTGTAGGAVGVTTVTRSANTQDPFLIARASSGVTNPTAQIFVDGFAPWSTLNPMVEIWNMGWIGSKVSDWTDTSHNYGPFRAVQGIVADLWSVELGANDINGGVSAATYQSGLTTLVSAFGTVGTPDKLIIEVHPTNPGGASFDIPASYRTAMATIATSNSLLTPPDFSGAGLTLSDYYDNIHLANSGYVKEASQLFGSVRSHLAV